MHNQVNERIGQVRNFLKSLSLDALIIPTADPHLSEYIDPHYAVRQWLSGFTGSNGNLIIATTGSSLFTDSRYWVQAQRQLLETEITLTKVEGSFIDAETVWLKEHLSKGSKVGVFGAFISDTEATNLKEKLNKAEIALEILEKDPIDSLWTNRPELTFHPIFEHKISPRTTEEKLSLLKPLVEKSGAKKLLLSSLEDIAWLSNLRGKDLPGTPVFYSYGIYDVDTGLTLFINEKALPIPLGLSLVLRNINFQNYEDLPRYLENLANEKILYSPDTTNALVSSKLKKYGCPIKIQNPVELLRAQKSITEIQLFRKAMKKDGIALCKFFCWLDENKNSGQLTEKSVADKLLEFRKQQPGFLYPSFATISAFGANAALPHYQPDEENPVKIQGNGFLLIDSGAQFPEGTTDITRTVLVGEASEQMKEDYTAVFRANICLAKTIFPNLIPSQALDAIARAPIWQNFVNYGHGTGHGVGFFLNVHEGPQRISYPRATDDADAIISKATRMRAGMVTSNEPGIYREGQWGIRIENLLANIPSNCTEFGEFLKFETLTLCPIELDAVNPKQLQADEINWINSYHTHVWEILSPTLKNDSKTLDWLKEKTKPIC